VWSGTLALHVAADVATDQEAGTCVLELAPGSLQILTAGATDEAEPHARPHHLSARLSPGAFTQLAFGFRPVWWIASQPGNDVPDAARPVLDALFPAEPVWIAATDGF
jgi:hypothetical protein